MMENPVISSVYICYLGRVNNKINTCMYSSALYYTNLDSHPTSTSRLLQLRIWPLHYKEFLHSIKNNVE